MATILIALIGIAIIVAYFTAGHNDKADKV